MAKKNCGHNHSCLDCIVMDIAKTEKKLAALKAKLPKQTIVIEGHNCFGHCWHKQIVQVPYVQPYYGPFYANGTAGLNSLINSQTLLQSAQANTSLASLQAGMTSAQNNVVNYSSTNGTNFTQTSQ